MRWNDWAASRSNGTRGIAAALLEAAIYLNAAVTSFDVAREVGVLDGARPRVVYGVYDLANVRVRAVPSTDIPFGDAPVHAADFAAISSRLAEAVLAKLPAG